MRTNLKAQIAKAYRCARHAAPLAAVATSAISPAALGDPGDLDPSFADVGRYYLPVDGAAVLWSIDPQYDGLLLSGGFEGYLRGPGYGYSGPPPRRYVRGFNIRMSGDGMPDDLFTATYPLNDVEVFDTATRSDGKIVGLGHRINGNLLFRLAPDGALDNSFGTDGIGILQLSSLESARSFVLDPDGAIAIAGLQGNDIKVLRLHADGSVDTAFGTSGVFTDTTDASSNRSMSFPRIVGALNGGYRITDNAADVDTGVARCRVVGVTGNGTLDASFGDAGYAGIQASGSALCNDIVQAADGGLLIGGVADEHGLVVRLLASGAADTSFGIDVPSASEMAVVTALAVDGSTGAVVLAGQPAADITGGLVTRLHADGSPDDSFGGNGTAWFDLQGTSSPNVNAMHLRPNGDVIVGGSHDGRPYAARLVGGDGRDGPGVLALARYNFATAEAEQAVVTVRRIAGKAGSVSVGYATSAGGDATEGDDFTAVSGRLEWADGDASDKQILVPIAPDTGVAEEVEYFGVELSDAQGGAGLGTLATNIAIEADGSPNGLLAVYGGWIPEEIGTLEVTIERRYYTTGAVTVTVTPIAGTAAAGEDFTGEPVTVSWADGEGGVKYAAIAITNDSTQEPVETFTVELSSATGGALIGPSSVATFEIGESDMPEPPLDPTDDGGGGGGGGRIGLLSLLLVGLVRLRRRGAIRESPPGAGRGQPRCPDCFPTRPPAVWLTLLLGQAEAFANSAGRRSACASGRPTRDRGCTDQRGLSRSHGRFDRAKRPVLRRWRDRPDRLIGRGAEFPARGRRPRAEWRHDLRGVPIGHTGPRISTTRQGRPAGTLVRGPRGRIRRACGHHSTSDGVCSRSRREVTSTRHSAWMAAWLSAPGGACCCPTVAC